MPTRIDVLPEDIKIIIYKKLYSSILCDMRKEAIYKNTKYFHKLLEITSDPLIYDLDYLGMLNITCVYDIFKNNRCYELFQPETAIYQRSHFTKNLEITLDGIEISNEPLYNLYKSNKQYYWAFVKEYITLNEGRRIHKASFIFRQPEPFSCMAELLYNIIEFYNHIRFIIYAYIHELECLEDDIGILTQRQRKDKYILEDILGYHTNNRFIIRIDYDIDTKTAYPILLSY